MTCPNCQSHEIIAVQEQFFCVNCGRMLSSRDVAAHQSSATPKRKAGRPRAVGLDAPIAAARRAVAAAVAKEPLVTDIVAPTPKSPSRGVNTKSGSSLASLTLPNPVWLLIGLPGGCALAGAIWYGSQAQLWPSSAALGLAGLLWLRLTRAAVVYHQAGVYDHRSMGINSAVRATLDRSPRLIGLSLGTGVFIALEAVMGSLIWFYGSAPTQLQAPLHYALIFLGYFGLLYLALGHIATLRLADSAVMVGNQSLGAAYRVGERLWHRHHELLGAELLGLLAVLGSGVGAALLIQRSLPTAYQLPALLAIGVLLAILIAIISGASAATEYRRGVRMAFRTQAARLLGGRSLH